MQHSQGSYLKELRRPTSTSSLVPEATILLFLFQGFGLKGKTEAIVTVILIVIHIILVKLLFYGYDLQPFKIFSGTGSEFEVS